MSGNNKVYIISGDGDTPKTAILFSECDIDTRVRTEYVYMCERFGKEDVDWERGLHLTKFDFSEETEADFLSEWVIRLSDGTYRSVYFDTRNTIYKEE